MIEPGPWSRSTRKKRESQFPEKREAVLNTAAALFRDLGYERASLSDLADFLKITKPTIYYYVHSKEQLLLDILRTAQGEVLASFAAAEAGPGTGYQKLRRMMIDYALVMISDRGACLAQVSPRAFTEPEARKEVEQRIQEADRTIYRILELGLQDGTLKFSDRAIVLHTFFGSLNWTAYWAKANGRLSPMQLAEAQVDLLLQGVGSGRARAKAAKAAPAIAHQAVATAAGPKARKTASKAPPVAVAPAPPPPKPRKTANKASPAAVTRGAAAAKLGKPAGKASPAAAARPAASASNKLSKKAAAPLASPKKKPASRISAVD
jgi:AcrR family transcriptional regulator